METSGKPQETQSNGRVNLNIRYNQPGMSLEAGYTCVLYTPRFSYRCPKTGVRHCAPCTGSVASAVYSGVRWRGTTRVVYRRVGTGEGYTGTHPAR